MSWSRCRAIKRRLCGREMRGLVWVEGRERDKTHTAERGWLFHIYIHNAFSGDWFRESCWKMNGLVDMISTDTSRKQKATTFLQRHAWLWHLFTHLRQFSYNKYERLKDERWKEIFEENIRQSWHLHRLSPHGYQFNIYPKYTLSVHAAFPLAKQISRHSLNKSWIRFQRRKKRKTENSKTNLPFPSLNNAIVRHFRKCFIQWESFFWFIYRLLSIYRAILLV